MGAFKLNGTDIKNPNSFQIEYYTLTKSTRVANGDMVMEYVNNKRKFNFGYTAIQSSELDDIIDLLWTSLSNTRQCMLTLTYLDNNQIKTATIYSGSIPKKLHRGHGSNWVWKDVNFSLIEK